MKELIKIKNFFIVDVKAYQKWYGGDENDFHYFLNAGLIIGVIFKYFRVLGFNFLRFKDLDLRFKSLNMLSCKDKIISQKFFYVFEIEPKIEIDDYISLITRKKIKINNKEKNMLELYLKKQNIDIRYFENFQGYLIFSRFEGYNKNIEKYCKGIVLYFYNDIWLDGKKNNFIFFHYKEDIKNINIIIKKYLKKIKLFYNINYNEIELKFLNFFSEEDKNFLNFIFYFSLQSISNYYNLLKYLNYLENFFEQNFYIYRNFENKNYINIKIKDNINYEEIENFFEIMYKSKKESLLNFKGAVYLFEINFVLIEENMKIKRLIIYFFNENIKEWIVNILIDSIDFFCVISLLKFYFQNDKNFNNDYYEEKIKNIVHDEYIFNSEKYKIEENSLKIIKLKDLEELIYFLEYYLIFINN